MALTLYGYEGNPRSQIVRIVAAAEEVTLQHSLVVPRKNLNTEEYIAKFPLSRGKIPALEGPDVRITEVIAIAWYIASLHEKAKLRGEGVSQQAEVLSWCSWANQEFLPTLAQWFLPLIPGLSRPAPYTHDAVAKGKDASLQMLDRLNAWLKGKSFLIGDHLTLADVFVTIYLSRGFQWVLDQEWRDAHPETMTYFQHKTSLECFRKVVNDLKLIDKETPNKDPYNS